MGNHIRYLGGQSGKRYETAYVIEKIGPGVGLRQIAMPELAVHDSLTGIGCKRCACMKEGSGKALICTYFQREYGEPQALFQGKTEWLFREFGVKVRRYSRNDQSVSVRDSGALLYS